MPKEESNPVKLRSGCSVPAVTKVLKFTNFTGEIVLASAEKGRALMFATHEDGHKPTFVPTATGWDVT